MGDLKRNVADLTDEQAIRYLEAVLDKEAFDRKVDLWHGPRGIQRQRSPMRRFLKIM